MKNNIVKLTTLSLATIAILNFTGCGSSDSDSTTNFTSITGKAVDGYLSGSTVCLDLNLDNTCSTIGEATTTTDADGDYTLNITQDMKDDPNFDKAPILIYGGIDTDTNKSFEGVLSAVFDGVSSNVNVTPVTTLVQTLVDEQDLSLTEAKNKVIDLLDLPAGTNLDEDPIALAKENNNTDLLAGALKLQKSIEIVADKLNTTSMPITVKLTYKELSKQIESGNSSSLDSALTSIVSTFGLSYKDENLTSNITDLLDNIDTLMANAKTASNLDTSLIGQTISTMQTKVESGKSLDDVNLTIPKVSTDITNITSDAGDFKSITSSMIVGKTFSITSGGGITSNYNTISFSENQITLTGNNEYSTQTSTAVIDYSLENGEIVTSDSDADFSVLKLTNYMNANAMTFTAYDSDGDELYSITTSKYY